MLTHKGFVAHIDYDEDAGMLTGEVLNAPDVLVFSGRSAGELKEAFEKTINEYLRFCEIEGEPKVSQFVSNLALRINSEHYRRILGAARKQNKNVEQWALEVLEQAAIERAGKK
jgi:predicted HicB family RNase H-like nuclease|tara:strand:- start:446 stop:787 length:342 start_codon:yes stop_codon:yes gene_type:complete